MSELQHYLQKTISFEFDNDYLNGKIAVRGLEGLRELQRIVKDAIQDEEEDNEN